MTEADWLSGQSAVELLRYIEPTTSDRKLHYFGIACARRIGMLVPLPASLHGIDVLEGYVEGTCDAAAIKAVSWDVEGAAFAAEHGTGIPWIEHFEEIPDDVLRELVAHPDYPLRPVRQLLISAAYFVDAVVSTIPPERGFRESPQGWGWSLFQPVSLVHEVFGNPFRKAKVIGRWKTEAVVGLARGVYDSRDFSAMPVLADALEDASCEHADIINHCRNAGPHVRGCWVVDAILGKK
jgi:hypothetical protein